MPIREDKLDRIGERKPLLDKMEDGMFYSFQEMTEIILGERLPVTPEEIESYFQKKAKKEEPSSRELTTFTAILFSNNRYVLSVLATLNIRGEIIVGYKDGEPYYGKLKTK